MKLSLPAILILLCAVYAQDEENACKVAVVRSDKEIDDLNQKSIKGTNPDFVLSIGKFTDARDNKTYKTTKIGPQVWMAENLNYNAKGSVCYGNLETNCKKYGRLYDWESAKDTACPDGWRLPKGEEWEALVNFVRPTVIWKSGMNNNFGNVSGTKLKAKKGWSNNGNGTDNYSFSALPGGQGNAYGDFMGAGYDGTWWSQASAYYGGGAWTWNMYHNYSYVPWSSGEENLRSIRCVIDEKCNGKSYNPSTQKCSDDGKTVLTRCRRSNDYYDASTHFCFWRNNKIYEKCNNYSYEGYNTYEPDEQFCFKGKVYNKCGTQDGYNPSTHFCSGDGLKIYGAKFTDSRDKKTYKTTKIGTQTWMAENLNYRGTEADTIGRCFNNDTINCNIYGRLYNWTEAKNACPKGWHLPNDKEWTALIKYAGDSLSAAEKLKSTDWGDRYFGNSGRTKNKGTDNFGFTALSGGTGNSDGNFYNPHTGNWWSATENSNDANSASWLDLDSGEYDGFHYDGIPKKPEFRIFHNSHKSITNSVRCIKDETEVKK